jgi:17beta-estradiol 17-dehydrogenase / very-long-chain 3-oxoacyl-CoA reductase
LAAFCGASFENPRFLLGSFSRHFRFGGDCVVSGRELSRILPHSLEDGIFILAVIRISSNVLSQIEKVLIFFDLVGALSLLTIIYKLFHFFYPYLRSGSLERYNKYNGAWAFVTGSSDGIGQAIAHELCSKGFNIILHGRNPTKLSKVQSNLLASFPKTQFRSFVADAGAFTGITTAAVRDLVASIKDLNLTVLANNVGGTGNMAVDFMTFAEHTTKEIGDLILINMLLTTHPTHALLPLLTWNQPALIINIGSASHTGMPYMPVYSPTKANLSVWGNALSIEMQSEGLDVEVLTVLSGNTQSGQDTRAASLFRPTSRTSARAALTKVGCGRTAVVGYFWHGFQAAAMGLMPEWARGWG